MRDIVIAAYFILLGIIAVYGIHLYWLIWIYLRRQPTNGIRRVPDSIRPRVTIQLPVYNEQMVVRRLIRAAAAQYWDRDRLEIQVLDDSTDVTSDIAAAEVCRLRRLGYNIVHIRRNSRTGFKAGALAHGLETATGEFVAIFDADNVPRPDFLNSLMSMFIDPKLALVQARWSFLNRDVSLLCRAQALFLDAHFFIEQAARSRGGLCMNFNGTAGIWRRAAIEDSGGWQSDTLTEDLDLSYRAQLRGWRMVLAEDVDVPTEVPSSIRAFKSQQYRWAKGAFETGLKLLPDVWTSALPRRVKLAAFFHLTQKSISVALLLLSLLLIPALYFRLETGMLKVLLLDLPIFAAGTGSMSLFYGLAYRRGGAYTTWRSRLVLPLLSSIGIGLAVNNSIAVLSAFSRRHSAFVRTPKTGETRVARQSLPKEYRVSFDHTGQFEGLLSLYSMTALICALGLGLYASLPFLMTFVFGYTYFAVTSFRERYA